MWHCDYSGELSGLAGHSQQARHQRQHQHCHSGLATAGLSNLAAQWPSYLQRVQRKRAADAAAVPAAVTCRSSWAALCERLVRKHQPQPELQQGLGPLGPPPAERAPGAIPRAASAAAGGTRQHQAAATAQLGEEPLVADPLAAAAAAATAAQPGSGGTPNVALSPLPRPLPHAAVAQAAASGAAEWALAEPQAAQHAAGSGAHAAGSQARACGGGGKADQQPAAPAASPPSPPLPPTPVAQAAAAETRSAADVAAAGAAVTTAAAAVVACAPDIAPAGPAAAATTAAAAQTQQPQAPLQPQAAARQQQQGVEEDREEEAEEPDSVLKLPAPKSLDELKQVLQQHASTPAPRPHLEGAKYRAPPRGRACEPAECVPAEPQVAQVTQVAQEPQVGCCESPGTPGSSARCSCELAAATGAELQPPPPPQQQQHEDAKDAPQHSNRSGGSRSAAAGAAGGHSGGGVGACRRHGAVKRKRGPPAAAAGGDPQQPVAQRRRLTGVPTCSANVYGAGKSRSLAAGAAGDGGAGSAATAAADPDGAVMLVPPATPSLAAAARPQPLPLPSSPAGKAGWEQQQRPQQQRGSHARSVGGAAAGGGQRADVGAGTAAGTAPSPQPPPLQPPVPASPGGAARFDPKSLTAPLRSPDITSAELASQLLGPNTCMEPAAAALQAGGGHGPEQQVPLTEAACRRLERVVAAPGAAGGDSSDAAVGMALARCLLRLMSLGPDSRPDTAEAVLWGNRFPDLLPAAGLHAFQTGTMQQPEAQELLLACLQAVQDLCGVAGGRDRLGARFVPLALAVLSHISDSVCAYSLRLRRAAASTLLDLVTESRGNQLALFDATAASSASTSMTDGAAGDEVAAAADAAASLAKHADRVFRELLPAAADYPTQLDLLEALYRACCGGTRSAAARERQSAAASSRERLVAAGERVLGRYLPPKAAACMAGLVSKRKRVKEEDLAARLRRVLSLVNQAQGERASVFSYHAEEVLLAGAPAGLRFAERWVDVAVLDSGSRTQSRNDDHATGGPSSDGGGSIPRGPSGPSGPRRPSGHLTLRAQVRNAELPKDEQPAPEPLTIPFDDIVAVTVSPPSERRSAVKATNAAASTVAAAAGDGAAATTTNATNATTSATTATMAPAPLFYVLITLSRLPEGLGGAAAAGTDRPAAAGGDGGGWQHAPVLRLKLSHEDARALLRRLPQETVGADSAGAGPPGPGERRRGTRPDATAARAQLPAVPPPPTAPTAAAAAATPTDAAADVSLPQPLMLAAVVPMATTVPATPAAAAAAALVAIPTGAIAATPATFTPAATPAPPLQQVVAVPRAPGRRRKGGAGGTAAHGEDQQSQQLPSSSSSRGGAAVGSCGRPAANHPPPAAGGGAAGGPCSRPPAAGAGAEAGDTVAVGSGPGAVRRADKSRRARCRRKQPRPRRYLVDAHVLVAPVPVQQAQLQQLPRPPQVPPAPLPLQPPPPPPPVVPLAPQPQQLRQTYSANGPEPSLQHAAAAVALFIGHADAAREVLQQVGMGGSDSDTSSGGAPPALGCILLATTAQSRWHGGIEPSRGRPGGDLMRVKR